MIAGAAAVVALLLAAVGVGVAQYSYGPAAQQQADVKAEIRTAITHAGFAAGGSSLGYTQQHLGHALNCIEGPKGKNFNASWGNVCEGQGNGILIDLKAASGGAALMPDVEKADTAALAGLKTKNLEEAKGAAKSVSDTLSGVLAKLK
jgi:hypothetical protein